MLSMARLCLAAALALWFTGGAAVATAHETALESVVSVLPVMPPERFRAEEPEGSGVVVATMPMSFAFT
jgi:predicted phosphoribosyltransferase